MAFPTTETRDTSEETTATNSHTLAFTAAASGELILAIFSIDTFDDTTVTVAWTDFTELFDVQNSNDIVMSVGYKISTGGETSETVTSSYSGGDWSDLSSHITYVFSG